MVNLFERDLSKGSRELYEDDRTDRAHEEF